MERCLFCEEPMFEHSCTLTFVYEGKPLKYIEWEKIRLFLLAKRDKTNLWSLISVDLLKLMCVNDKDLGNEEFSPEERMCEECGKIYEKEFVFKAKANYEGDYVFHLDLNAKQRLLEIYNKRREKIDQIVARLNKIETVAVDPSISKITIDQFDIQQKQREAEWMRIWQEQLHKERETEKQREQAYKKTKFS